MEKKYCQPDEMSRLIDAMNKKEKVSSDDQEALELARFAAKIKASAASPALPEELVRQTSDILASELGSRAKPKKRKWFLPGAAGTVAAAVVAAVMQFSSHTVPAPPPQAFQLPEQGIIEIKQMQPDVNLPQSPPQPVVEDKGKPAPAEPPAMAKNTTPPAAEQVEPVVPRANSVKNNMLASKAAVTPPAQEEPSSAAVTKPPQLFTLAGKTAKTTTVSDGQVRHVYVIDDSEVTVTQPSSEAAGVSAARTYRAAATDETKASIAGQKADDKSSEVNQVTVEKNGKTITIEGRKSKEELKKVADELVEKE